MTDFLRRQGRTRTAAHRVGRPVRAAAGLNGEVTDFLARPAPRLPGQQMSGRALVGLASGLVHAVVFGLLISAAMFGRASTHPLAGDRTSTSAEHLPRVVFLATPGPGGGGGGGGNRQRAPIPRAQAPGRDAVTVPVARRVVMSVTPMDAPPPQQLLLDAAPLASGIDLVVGLPTAQPGPGGSRGPGDGGGVGEGSGTGIGSGRGPGLGPGSGGGSGGGPYRIGSGVTTPTVVTLAKPTYTADAMRTKIQGSVLLEVIVQRDGTPGDIRAVHSLDPGLDERAIEAARQWRFIPGRLGGAPVDVLVTIIMDFSVR